MSEEKACSNTPVDSIVVTRAECPLSCPMPHQPLWSEHPRVYLPIEKTGKAVCPYCNTHYILKDF